MMPIFDIHIHGAETKELRAITCALTEIKELIMTTNAEFTAAFAEIDTATTAIAARIDELVAKQQAGGMTEAEEAANLGRLQALTGTLKAMGKSPDNPVPVPVPPADPDAPDPA